MKKYRIQFSVTLDYDQTIDLTDKEFQKINTAGSPILKASDPEAFSILTEKVKGQHFDKPAEKLRFVKLTENP